MRRDISATQIEVDGIRASHVGLAERIAQWTVGVNRHDTPIQGLTFHRSDPTSYMLAPSLCLIGQGKKRVFLGEDVYVYDAHHYLISSVDLPVVAQILEASSETPYLGLTLEINMRTIARLMVERDIAPSRPSRDQSGIAVSKVSPILLDAFKRLIDLLDQPEDIPVLSPLVQQEIAYRLLVGEQGPWLRQIVSGEGRSHRIARAIEWLKNNFDKPLKVDDLAKRAGLSASAFHNHFRAVTSMSPLQYQKRMRLNEARQLMLTERMEASTAAFEVGYESPTQFSREYSRMFGAPPMRDIKNLLETAPC